MAIDAPIALDWVETERLRSTVMKTAELVRIARLRAERALLTVNEELAIKTEELRKQREWFEVTLSSVGDAVITTDTQGLVTYLNPIAETMTGWLSIDAFGEPIDEIFRIVNEATQRVLSNPIKAVLKTGKNTRLPTHTALIDKNGAQVPIEDSIAPIRDTKGNLLGAVIVFHDVSAARELSLRMSHLAQHDGLTDLPNRILLYDRLTQAITLAKRRRKKLAVLFLDLDRFKHINDSLGHAIGDRVLQSVAERLRHCVRSTDTVSRQGGDEFVVLLSEIKKLQDAAVCAEKILAALSEPFGIDHHNLYAAVSIGIATYPDDGTDADTLMKHADLAMYQAKEGNSNTFRFFERQMTLHLVERQEIESDLRRAIDRDQFVLYYQARVDLITEQIVGVEVLIRWKHPARGLVQPDKFMAIAEESGVVVPLGRWVLREGCRQGRAWLDAGMPPVRVAVNISAVELRAKDFVEGVRNVLAETGLEPSSLELEVTETALLQNSKAVASVLQAIKDLGVHLALDDFGTGYSSLSHVRRLPIDALKIDRSFIRELATNADDASVVRAMISMGRSLQMKVVAEGVETREQLECLRRYGCPEGQGYYFSKAVDAADFTRLLRRGI
ncbi:MAG: putative bifunctional diguanylate cyclase/phosphodiesterase [Steroidobacteraceae bacterium]